MKKRYLKLLGLSLALSFGFILTNPSTVKAENTSVRAVSTWKDNQYLDEQGNPSTGLVTIQNKKYYFDSNGFLNPNQIVTVDGIQYKTLEDGSVLEGKGFVKVGDNTFYIDNRGVATGLKTIDSEMYYFDENGFLVKNSFIQLKNTRYYATESGKLASGWITVQELKYYFNPVYHFMLRGGTAEILGKNHLFTDEGNILSGTGLHEYKGKTYYTKEDDLQTGLVELEGNLYYFDKAKYSLVKNQFVKIKDKTYSSDINGNIVRNMIFDKDKASYAANQDGVLASGFTRIDNKLYYFNPVYHFMLKNGIAEIYGKKYLFRQDGSILEGSGFVKDMDKTYYIGDKGLTTGMTTIQSKKYIFSSTGVMSKPGFFYDGPWKTYYSFQDGSLASGWTRIDNKLYYFNPSFYTMLKGGIAEIYGINYLFRPDGSVLEGKGFVKDNDDTYYIGKKGILTGKQEIEGKKYIFSSKGIMGTPGFFKDGDKTFYIFDDGSLAKGWSKINDALYYFEDKHNYMYQNGVFEVSGKKYLFAQDGKLIETPGFAHSNGKTYYVNTNRVLHTGVLAKDGSTFFFDQKNGSMKKNGIQNINGKLFYFDQDGKKLVESGLKEINKSLFYFDQDGHLLTGWQYHNGNKYYFNPVYGFGLRDGKAQIGDSVYLFNADGSVYKGWKTEGKNLYYYHPVNGYNYRNVAITVDGKVRLFNESGINIREHGLHKVGGYTYYVKSNGEVMVNGGTFSYDGKKYINQGSHVFNFVPDRGWDVSNGTWMRYNSAGNVIDSAWAGSNFVVISIDQQTMWVYNGGKEVVSTPVVTGMRGVLDTPRGKYRINRKESPSVLVGANYRTRVDYWMPFVGNMIGIHDAPWQPWFGGNRYTFGGSHGCVNTPGWSVGIVWRNVSVGTPVIVY